MRLRLRGTPDFEMRELGIVKIVSIHASIRASIHASIHASILASIHASIHASKPDFATHDLATLLLMGEIARTDFKAGDERAQKNTGWK